MARNRARWCLSPACGRPRSSGHQRYAVDLSFAVYNVINSSAAIATSYLSGTFGRITNILPPRVARLGLEFSF